LDILHTLLYTAGAYDPVRGGQSSASENLKKKHKFSIEFFYILTAILLIRAYDDKIVVFNCGSNMSRSLKKLLFFNFNKNRFFDTLWKTLVLQKNKHPHKKRSADL
jgi:hypothetical protein